MSKTTTSGYESWKKKQSAQTGQARSTTTGYDAWRKKQDVKENKPAKSYAEWKEKQKRRQVEDYIASKPQRREYVEQRREYLQQESLRRQQAEYERAVKNRKARETAVSRAMEDYDRDISVLENALEEYQVRSRTMQDQKGEERLAYLRSQYGEIDELKNRIGEARRKQNTLRRTYDAQRLAGAGDPNSEYYDPDFDKYSGYRSSEHTDKLLGFIPVKDEDITYEYINADAPGKQGMEQKYRDYLTRNVLSKGYGQMTDEEVALYNYHYAKSGREGAERYLDTIQERLNQRQGQIVHGNVGDGILPRLGYGAIAGYDQFKSGMEGMDDALEGKDSYVPPSSWQYASGLVREDLEKSGPKLPEWLGGASLGQMAYDTVTTTANMAPSILTSMVMDSIAPGSGSYVGSGMMGASAAGSAYQEAIGMGADVNQARAYGTLVGASEAALGELLGGIKSLGGKLSGKAVSSVMSKVDNALLRAAGELGGRMLSEFSEEYLQEVLTPWFQNITMDMQNEVSLLSPEAVYSGLLGALSAGVLEGGPTIAEGVSRNREDQMAAETPVAGKEQNVQPETTDVREEMATPGVARVPEGTVRESRMVEEEDVPDTDVGDMEEDVLASLSDLGLHEEEARVLRENFRDSGMDPGEYAIGVRTAFQYGQMGIPARELARSDSAAGSLAEYQRITAYKYGRLHGQQQAQAEQKNLAGKTVGEHRNVEFDGDWSRLNDAQMAGITAVNALGETLGVRYRFYESYQKGKQRVYLDENGVEKNAPNGFYKDGVIHLDVNAGSDGQGTVLFTAAHEMTHFIREWSPEKFRVLADTLMEGYAGTDTSVEQLINEKIAAYRDSGENLSFEQAFEEVVADSMETMLSDGSFAQRVQKLKQTDRTLWEKIRDWFVSMADSIRKAYENLKPDSREGQLVAEMVDTAEKLKELFAEAAVDAAGNLQRAEKNTAGEGGEVKYSLRDVAVPSREELEQKQPVKVVDISRPQTEGSFAQRRKQILADAKNVMARPYRNRDTGAMIFLTDKSYTHLFSNPGEMQINAAERLPELIQNAVLTHAEAPDHGSEYADGVYTFFAAVKGERILPVKLKVKEYAYGGQLLPKNIRDYFGSNPGDYASTYDTVVLEVEEIEESSAGSARDTAKHGIAPGPEELSTVTVAELLGLVKGEAEKYVPKHKMSQEDGTKFSLRDSGEAVVQTEQILTDDAVTVDRDGTRYSLRSMKKDIAEGQMFEDLKTHCGWTPEQTEKLKSDLQGLVEYMMPHRDILDMNESYDREGRKFSPYKPNSDPLYKISMDFSTLCSKRLLTQYVIENLQVREGRPMSAEEQMAIRDMLNEYRKQEKGLQVACAMCYVEAARLKSPKQISRWIEDPEAAMKDYFAKKNPEFRERVASAQAEFKRSRGYSGDTAKKGMKPKDVRELNLIGPRMRSEYRPSDAEQAIISRAVKLPSSTYLTAGNLANLSEAEPEIYEAYTTFIRNATRSKSLETDEPYYYGDSRRDNGNGIVVTDTFIENVNRENGMRFSSWSDWRIQHMLDYITAVIDNSVRGAAMHGYTKFPEEVRVLGKTGMMFNMSGVAGTQSGLNPDGSLSFSETESIDVNEAVELREQFPDTAGLQCIGVSDAHITALLRSDIIDYVIPYHTSGLNAGLRRMANIHGWKDYTSTQHAAVDKSIRKEDAADPEHWHEEPVYSDFFVGYDTGMSGIEAMQASAERYKQLCRDRGLKPKFEKFAEEDGYWKLLIDRKMVNQKTGELIRQKPVSPEFDFGEIRNVVDRYVENYDFGLEARALRHITENWDSVPDRIQDLKKQKKAGKAAKTLANQTMAAMPSGTNEMLSLRDPEHQAVQEALEQENEKLRKDVADLKELVKLQRTVTNGTKFTKTSVEAAAGLLIEKVGVSRGKQELAPILERFYEFVAKNEGYDWSDVAAQTQEAVDWLLEHRKKHTGPDDYSREILDKVRSMRIRLNDTQTAEAANLYGSVNEFRKRMMGSVVIGKDGTALDEAWQELADLYPGVFDPNVTDGDMPVKLAEIVGRLRSDSMGENAWRYEQEVLGQELIREVYDSYWQVSNMRTFADVKQKEIDRLKLKHFNQMDKLRTEHREKVAQLKAGHRDQITAIRKEHREAMETQAREASARYQESRKKAMDNRHRSEEKQKIRIMFRELDRILNRGNKKRNVKEGMQEFAASAIASAELLFSDYIADEDLIRNGIGTEMISKEQETLSKAQDLMEQIGRMSGYDSLKQREKLEQKLKGYLKELNPVFVRERARLNKAGADRVFGDLIRAYEELKESPYSHIQMAYDDGTLALLKSLQADVGSSPVKDMNLAQLEALHKVLTVVTNKIRTANKAFADGKTMEQTVTQAAEEIRQRKIPDKKMLIAIRNLENKTGWDYEKPVYALKRIGSDAITKLFLNLMDSENTAMADVDECKTFLDQMVEKYGYNDWTVDRKLDRTFVDSTGKKFRMTTGELMSLYAYARRGDGMRHIETGGFTMEHKALTDADAAIAYKLSPDMVNAITDLLTAEQKGFVEEMQTFLSETMGAKGNEVSMKLYGIKLFGEKNYFPIHMSGAYKQNVQEAQAKQAQGFGTLSNAGFTKAQNKNATGVVVMEPFLEVWADHCNEMSRYHATVPALEDIRRVMNYSRTMDSTTDSMSLKALIENRYGKEAVQYLDNLYREANSGPVQDKLQTRGQKALGMFRKNAVAYSSSVLIQQPAAITRAYAMIPKKYFGGLRGIGGLPVGIGKTALDRWGHWQTKAYEEMRRYAPGVTIAKEIGGFDTASGSTIRSYLLDTGKNLRQSVKTEGAKGLAKGTMKLVDDNAVANLPNLMDKIAWIEIWNACKRETAEKRKDLEQGSEAFLEAAGQRFTDVIRSTQVYDSVFAKSPLLRSKNVWVQSAVSFMNEPNTAANMMEQAVRDAARGDWTQAGRTFSAVARCVIFTGVLKAVVYALRDDEEDETFLEKYLAELAGSLVADVNPVNYIPFARDVWSVAQGYGADRTDMAIFSDILTPLNKWIELREEDRKDLDEAELEELDQRTTEALWKTLETGATLIRVPVKNIRREIDMVLRVVDAVWHRQEKKSGTALSIRDKVEEAMAEAMPAFLRPEGKSKGDKLYYAILEGDAVYEERLRKRYEDPKIEDEELRQALADKKADTAIRKALRERDPRIRQAAESYVRGDLKEYEALAKEVIDEGFFSQNLVRDAIRAEAEEIVDKDPEMPSGKEKGLFTGDDFTAAVLAGDYYMAKRVRDDLIETAKKNGSSAQDAEKNFQSTARSGCKELYLTGQLSDSKAKSLLETYGGKTAEEAQKTVQYWKFSMKYPKYDLNEAAVSKYYNKIEKSGISVAQYAEFLEKLPDQANREETLAVINSMKLTRAQKDALYRAAGYAESRLSEAPWY